MMVLVGLGRRGVLGSWGMFQVARRPYYASGSFHDRVTKEIGKLRTQYDSVESEEYKKAEQLLIARLRRETVEESSMGGDAGRRGRPGKGPKDEADNDLPEGYSYVPR
mmetsp:Transcript_18218/g.51427  ORF Transcript_18218/g.51427 Transcript_18218/m.51427 type:complete len:108 (-) Transcript_18218:152-475(-)